MGAPAAYHRLSVVQKRAEALARARESAIRCEECWYQVMPAELLDHVANRCPGRPEPDPRCAWVTWSEAIDKGVTQYTLMTWVRDGLVRVNGEKHDRRYLLRDLVRWVARMRLERMRIAQRQRRMVRGDAGCAQLEMWGSR